MKKHSHMMMITKLRKLKKKKHIHNDDVDDIFDDDDDDDDEETLRCDETNLQLYQRNRTNNQKLYVLNVTSRICK